MPPAAHRIFAVTLAVTVLFSSGFASAQTDEQMRTLWSNLKKQLSSANGEEYFNYVKNSALPTLKRTLISGTFRGGVSKLILALTDSKTPEVTLILHNGDMKVTAEPNSQIEFQGMAVEFTKNPFMLTFDVSMEGIRVLKTERSRSR